MHFNVLHLNSTVVFSLFFILFLYCYVFFAVSFFFFFFFFSSRRRHTRSDRDWSSDVCSSDLPSARDPYFLFAASNVGSFLALVSYPVVVEPFLRLGEQTLLWTVGFYVLILRSEERRVGKECRCRGWAGHEKKKGDRMNIKIVL